MELEIAFAIVTAILTATATITEIILDHQSLGLISLVIITCVLNMCLMYLMISNFKSTLDNYICGLNIYLKLSIASIIYFTILLILLPLIALIFQPWYLWAHLLYALLAQLIFILIVCTVKYFNKDVEYSAI